MPRRVVPIFCPEFPASSAIAVERQDQRRGLGDVEQFGRDLDALLGDAGDLVAEVPGVEHHAVADDAERPADDARREQSELVGLAVDDQRVAGIVPALEAHDDVGALRQPVDDLALAFVTPLGADHGYVGHGFIPSL